MCIFQLEFPPIYLCSLEMIKLLMSYSALWTSWIRSLRLSLSTTLILIVYACYTSLTVTQTSALCMTYNRMWEIMMDQAQIRTTALWIFCSQVRYQLSYLAQVIKHSSALKWSWPLKITHPLFGFFPLTGVILSVPGVNWSVRHQM